MFARRRLSLLLHQAGAQADAGRYEPARRSLLAALRLAPGDVQALHALALVLHRQGRSDLALGCMRRAVALRPDQPLLLNDLANLLMATGDCDAALGAYQQSLQQAPRSVDTLYNRALALAEVGQSALAMETLREALDIAPDDPMLWVGYGTQLLRQRRSTEAEQAFGKALELQPRHADACAGLGAVALSRGRIEAARRRFEQTLHWQPTHPVARLQLARSNIGDAPAAAEIREAERALAETREAEARSILHFALGHLFERIGEAERAFEHFQRANRRVRVGRGFDPAAFAARVSELIEAVTPATLAGTGDCGRPSALPVFVAGPPRGGTSLVEQILSSHPEVEGIGESELLAQQLQRLPDDRRHHPASLADALSRTGARSVADAYLRQVRALCPDARRIVDKGYSVSLHLGFAALLFPGATLIEVRRDPLDTGWSLFGERFAPGLLPFAYDLGHIGAFLREYERLMRHWRGLLGERLLSVDYAALVSDPAPCVARMLEHCGLPWHEDCLHFERTRRNVFTASAWQVRKPLYGHSVGRARRFRPWLAELRAALDSPAGD